MINFLSTPLYVRLSPFRLSVRNVKTSQVISEVPEIALSRGPNPRILDVGEQAARHRSAKAAQIINPFSHPRSMVSDFSTGKRVLRAFIQKVNKRKSVFWAPRVVLHLQGEPSGGFTQVEIHTFHKMMRQAGAGAVTLWQGPELTDAQILSRRYPSTGQVLN